MTDSQDRDFSVVTTFARFLAGTLRPQSVADLLVAQVKATFGPVATAVALIDPETFQIDTVAGDKTLGEQRHLHETALSRLDPVIESAGGQTVIAAQIPARRTALGI